MSWVSTQGIGLNTLGCISWLVFRDHAPELTSWSREAQQASQAGLVGPGLPPNGAPWRSCPPEGMVDRKLLSVPTPCSSAELFAPAPHAPDRAVTLQEDQTAA